MTIQRAIVTSNAPAQPRRIEARGPKNLICLFCLMGFLAVVAQPTKAAIPVIDPSNLAVNVEKALQHLEMIKRMQLQIRNQMLMLENWKFTRLDDVLGDMQRIRRATGAPGTSGSPSNPAASGLSDSASIDTTYPINQNATHAPNLPGIENMREQWMRQQRQTIVRARTVQNVAYQQLSTSQARIDEYVQESNRAPGTTAAVQAGNEIIGTQIAQLQTLQALEIADAKAELERHAHRQARQSQSNHLRGFLFRDWLTQQGQPTTPAPKVKPVPNPFVIK